MTLATASTLVESRSSTQAGSPIPTRKASQITRLVIPILARNQGELAEHIATPNAGMLTSTPAPTSLPAATSAAVPTQTPAPMGALIRIGSQIGRASLANAPQVYASVLNDGGATAYDSALTITYLDDSDSIMGTGIGVTTLRMVRPGESSSVVTYGLPLSGWTHYRTSFVTQLTSPTTYVHDGLSISGVSASRAGTIITITGQVENTTNKSVGTIKIDISLFASDGTIVDAKVASPFTTSDTVPGDSAFFGVSFVNADGRIPANFTYTTRAEGVAR